LSRARGLLGIRIRWVRRLSSQAGAVGPNAKEDRSRKFGLGTSSGFNQAKSTGTVPLPTTAVTHIAIQEQLDGKAVDWMEKVSDEQYRK
jgi:hypothetical protein